MCTLQAVHDPAQKVLDTTFGKKTLSIEGLLSQVAFGACHMQQCSPNLAPVEALSQGRLCCPCLLAATSTTWSMSAKDTSATASQLVSTLKLSCRAWARVPGTALISGPCTMHALHESQTSYPCTLHAFA